MTAAKNRGYHNNMHSFCKPIRGAAIYKKASMRHNQANFHRGSNDTTEKQA
jgi:hypothetical protein